MASSTDLQQALQSYGPLQYPLQPHVPKKLHPLVAKQLSAFMPDDQKDVVRQVKSIAKEFFFNFILKKITPFVVNVNLTYDSHAEPRRLLLNEFNPKLLEVQPKITEKTKPDDSILGWVKSYVYPASNQEKPPEVLEEPTYEEKIYLTEKIIDVLESKEFADQLKNLPSYPIVVDYFKNEIHRAAYEKCKSHFPRFVQTVQKAINDRLNTSIEEHVDEDGNETRYIDPVTREALTYEPGKPAYYLDPDRSNPVNSDTVVKLLDGPTPVLNPLTRQEVKDLTPAWKVGIEVTQIKLKQYQEIIEELTTGKFNSILERKRALKRQLNALEYALQNVNPDNNNGINQIKTEIANIKNELNDLEEIVDPIEDKKMELNALECALQRVNPNNNNGISQIKEKIAIINNEIHELEKASKEDDNQPPIPQIVDYLGEKERLNGRNIVKRHLEAVLEKYTLTNENKEEIIQNLYLEVTGKRCEQPILDLDDDELLDVVAHLYALKEKEVMSLLYCINLIDKTVAPLLLEAMGFSKDEPLPLNNLLKV